MILNWFDASDAVAFAKEIVGEVRRVLPLDPPRPIRSGGRKNEKTVRRLDGLVRRTREFAQGRRLNVYQKGRLLNTLKWDLKEAGYDDALVDEVVALLTPALA